MAISVEVTYKFRDESNGYTFMAPPNIVFDVGNDPWIQLQPYQRAFAQFVAADDAPKKCTLARHEGLAAITRIPNETQLREHGGNRNPQGCRRIQNEKRSANSLLVVSISPSGILPQLF